MSNLKDQLRGAEERLTTNQGLLETKDSLLAESKASWSQLVTRWSQEQSKLVHQIQERDEEIARAKEERIDVQSVCNSAIRFYFIAPEYQINLSMCVLQQLKVCEESLEQSIALASDFQKRVEEEEKLKMKILDELLHERETNAKLVESTSAKIDQVEKEDKCKGHNVLFLSISSQLTAGKARSEQEVESQRLKISDLETQLGRERNSREQLERSSLDEKRSFQGEISKLEEKLVSHKLSRRVFISILKFASPTDDPRIPTDKEQDHGILATFLLPEPDGDDPLGEGPDSSEARGRAGGQHGRRERRIRSSLAEGTRLANGGS